MVALTWCVARALGDVALGRFAVIAGAVVAASSVLQFGTGFTATCLVARHLRHDPARAGGHASLSLLTASAIGIVGVAACVAAADAVIGGWLEQPGLARWAIAFGIASLAGAIVAPLQGICIACGAFRALVTGSALGGAGLLGAGGLALIGAPLEHVLLAYCGAHVLNAAGLAGLCLRGMRSAGIRPERPDGATIHEFMHFAVPAGLSGLFMQPITWLCTTLLFRSGGGAAQTGLFGAALSVRNLAMFVPALANRVGAAAVAERVRDDAVDIGVRSNAVVSGGAFVAAAVPIALASPWIMRSFGPEFAVAWPTLVTLLVAALFEVIQLAYYQRVQAAGRMWSSLAFIVLPREATMLACGAALAPRMGAIGLALALLAASIVGCVACVLVSRRGSEQRGSVA